jgi:hypothetical protein
LGAATNLDSGGNGLAACATLQIEQLKSTEAIAPEATLGIIFISAVVFARGLTPAARHPPFNEAF